MTKLPPPVFCALDTIDSDAALSLARRLTGTLGGIKLGLEFFLANGPEGVRKVQQADVPLFLDLKLYDIPNTVKGAIGAIAPLVPLLTTIHGAGGHDMIRAAVDAAQDNAARLGVRPMEIMVVTVLTSFDQDSLSATGVAGSLPDHVLRLAELAQGAGANGVICSPHEIAALRAHMGPDFRLVVPGIRPLWAAANDQKRILTPAEALGLGADWLVIGRPITDAANPAEAARRIADEIAGGDLS